MDVSINFALQINPFVTMAKRWIYINYTFICLQIKFADQFHPNLQIRFTCYFKREVITLYYLYHYILQWWTSLKRFFSKLNSIMLNILADPWDREHLVVNDFFATIAPTDYHNYYMNIVIWKLPRAATCITITE